MSKTRSYLPPRRLTDREAEVLSFLLTAEDLPDRDALRDQASVARVSGMCECGCASFYLFIDGATAPQAHEELPRGALVSTSSRDEFIEPERSIFVHLSVRDGWLDAVEISCVGDVTPVEFPRTSMLNTPEVTDRIAATSTAASGPTWYRGMRRTRRSR